MTEPNLSKLPFFNEPRFNTSRHIAKKAIARCIPIVGAVGVGAYAYYDTARVGKTAIELFSSNIE